MMCACFEGSGNNLVAELFPNNNSDASEFVGDEATKDEVKTISGNNALVLTVLEAKGMEFIDCQVHNFCKSCALKNNWRVLFEYFAPKQPHPNFNLGHHRAICAERKLL